MADQEEITYLHKEHPGISAEDCELRRTVTQKNLYGVITRAGFGCNATGGHCVPCDDCEARRIFAKQQDAFNAIFGARMK
jgi:hypothetical protein